ncbi:hypothetical protein FDK38_001745 [Candidozyma auris]|nr:hypothetical protein FDK38_001745 [[Candida] auris]
MGLFKRKERLDSPLQSSNSSLKSSPSPPLETSTSQSSKLKQKLFKKKEGESEQPSQQPDAIESSEEDPFDVEDEDESDYEPHLHTWLPRERTATVSQLSTLMGYMLGTSDSREGLQKMANEESKRTFSLLPNGYNIIRLSPTMDRKDPSVTTSIIGDPQVQLIKQLREKLKTVLDLKGDLQQQYQHLQKHETLFQRYGTVKDVIGRGAYGVIKVLDSGGSKKVYAVKELQKRSATDSKCVESSEKFIDRVISEFILSSTLNNKNIVRSVDLMVSLPPLDANIDTTAANFIEKNFKVNQVMESSNGGNLFAYIKKCVTQKHYITIDDIDCMIKQIASGLWYMHQHGVAHCDLKLENILIKYDNNSITSDKNGTKKTRMNLKISDFGKSSVFRTAWDSGEQPWPASNGPIGSEPFMAPEEHSRSCKSWSLAKKDCWGLGVLILVLYNVRRHYFCGASENFVVATYYDESAQEEDSKAYGSTYLWRRTDPKPLSKKFKDSTFDEYARNAMIADYDEKTGKWSIKKKGAFIPIETLFDKGQDCDKSSLESDLDDEGFEESDYELRRRFIYKLLDMNPSTRISVDALLRGAWLEDVESCCA